MADSPQTAAARATFNAAQAHRDQVRSQTNDPGQHAAADANYNQAISRLTALQQADSVAAAKQVKK